MIKVLHQAIFRPLAATLVVFSAVVVAAAQGAGFSLDRSPLPDPTGFVNDYVGVVDSATKKQLEERLKAFKDSSGVEIAVAVVDTTGDRDIFDYSLAVARGWGIGSKESDDPGALLFVAINDRKYFTQISRDLEPYINDGLAGSIQRQYLVPEFRKGNYSKGIADTVNAYIEAYEARSEGREPPVTASRPTRTSDEPNELFFCLAVIIFFIVLIFISVRKKNRKTGDDHDRWGGGGFGGGGGSVLPWIILGGSGGSSDSSSSSWDWGGGSDWGGFGGGGDFGGGGAGGSW